MFYEEEQVSLFDHDSWSGKMCPEHSQAEAPRGQTLRRSSKNSSKSQSRMPLCVSCRRVTDGQNPGVTMLKMEDGALLGEYTTHSFGESPREENASRLSQILEDSPHPKYSLSAKACQGILNRAERRGKELPEALRVALEMQSRSKNEQVAPGGGKGMLIQNERTGALSTLNNQSVCYGISAYESNAMKSANPHSGIYEADTARTLDLNGGNPACNQGGMAVVCLNDQGGQVMGVSARCNRHIKSADGCPPLSWREHNGNHRGLYECGSGSMQSAYGKGLQRSADCSSQQPLCIEMTSTKNTVIGDGVCPTLTARMGTGGNQVNAVLEEK